MVFVSRLPIMNHIPIKVNNFENVDAYEQFCKSILKKAIPGVIKEWQTFLDNIFVGDFKDLPAADKSFIEDSDVWIHVPRL